MLNAWEIVNVSRLMSMVCDVYCFTKVFHNTTLRYRNGQIIWHIVNKSCILRGDHFYRKYVLILPCTLFFSVKFDIRIYMKNITGLDFVISYHVVVHYNSTVLNGVSLLVNALSSNWFGSLHSITPVRWMKSNNHRRIRYLRMYTATKDIIEIKLYFPYK